MADDEDLFAVFAGEDVPDEPSKPSNNGSEDKMEQMEKQRQQQSKERADQLIAELTSSKTLSEDSKKRPLETEQNSKDEAQAKQKRPDLKTEAEIDEAAVIEAVHEDLGTIESLPRIQIHEVSTKEKCRHLVAVPHGQEYQPLVEVTEMIMSFPFTLDPFQNEAVSCINNNQSVLVSAHTSAGKTVCGLYAIARCLKDKQRVIYTTPIKALSNQKYRELEEQFQDVGLMTGDVTYNVDASCLVMTTEILRSMLYRGSELMREVGWVIFDEIHYMRDKERGVVWEETIILLPDNVHFVFLSATIPNAVQFAEWICFLHKQPCHVIYTDYRPVPLRSYIFAAGSDALHLVVDEQGNFKEDNFERAMSYLQDAGDAGKGDKRGRKGGTSGESNVKKVLDLLLKRNLNPVIVFSFSRKECESYGTQLKDQALNTEEEAKAVTEIFNSAIDVLSDEDKSLEQVTNLLPLLQSGVGIHHSGLLPILKETVEILFGEGLIKCLFATETFSMGLNMPARTVLFTNSRKFDGVDHRPITSGEFIQMSGRAGRRGIDDRGLVILMMDQMISSESVKQILKGEADPLNSQFRLTYNMILNLLRVEGINPEYMLERSFFQFQNYSALPDLYSKVQKTGKIFEETKVPREIEISGFYKIKQQISDLGDQLQKIITKPQYMVPFLQPGRLAHVKTPEHDFGWGIVINFQKKIESKGPVQSETHFVVDMLMKVAESSLGTAKNVQSLRPWKAGDRGVVEVIPVLLPLIKRMSAVRVKYESDLKPMQNRIQAYRTLEEVGNRFPDGFPLLDPIEDMQIKDPSLKEIVQKIHSLEERMMSHPLRKDKELNKLTEAYEAKLQAESDWKAAKQALKKAKSLLQMDELKCRKRVLRRLGYANDQDVITIKGRVACEISAADELVLTEMMFNKAFDGLTQQQCAALLSCFVFQENAEAPALSDELSGILRQMQETARRIAKVTMEVKLPIDEDKYVENFRPHIMDVVHSWCSGATFKEITTMTDCFEGSIIRAMRRLEELMREMVCAAKSIGNDALKEKFEEAISKMKRDIVFAASLYL